MQYCFNCSRITLGQPNFCTFCGRTYDIKLCNRLHANPREAQVCSQCGSRDMSTPQPKLSLWLRLVLVLLSVLPGIALLLLTAVFLIADIYILVVCPAWQFPFLLLSLVLALLWLLYMELPGIVRHKVHGRMRNASKKDV
jgi:RNA polymerase subunit RPABC4/transcription elongation factor Spt4